MTVPDADPLYLALTRIHPRALQVLVARFVAKTETGDGRSQAAFAAFYGVPEASAKVLLWRAVGEFDAALAGRPAPTPLPFEEEQRRADALCAALEAPLPPQSQELGKTVEALTSLHANASAIRERLARAEQAELSSPEYARETWLRRIAIVVVLAVSAWFYWQADLARWWRSSTPVEARDAGR
ncbi:MAG: hypothetical protein Q8S33_24140 [Myxococcales bacterium]|nr:hypothetical protein [Myxococcales bacterium]